MWLKRACKEGIHPQYNIENLGKNIIICIIEKCFRRSDFLFRKKVVRGSMGRVDEHDNDSELT